MIIKTRFFFTWSGAMAFTKIKYPFANMRKQPWFGYKVWYCDK